MYKNIIHITGNDSYGVELELERWLGAFRGKFGDINIDRYDLGDKDSMKWIGDRILMSGLFAEKRLFIFRGGRDRKSKAEWLEKILTEKIEDIPEDHYLLFHNVWEKEEWLTSWLAKNADTRKIDTIWDRDAWEKRSDIDITTLKLILSTYKSAEATRGKDEIGNPLLGHNIAHTIEMVSLAGSGNKLDTEDIIGLCHGYGGDTMFALADAVVSMDIARSIDILHRITATTKVDEWFGSWMGSLRNTLYIRYLREHGERESDIIDITRLHSYVVQKWYTSKISYSELQKLYNKLAMMSVAYKRGKWLRDSELWRILAIELALLDLQKSKNL
jgi:DNA polymerase III delta subunit